MKQLFGLLIGNDYLIIAYKHEKAVFIIVFVYLDFAY